MTTLTIAQKFEAKADHYHVVITFPANQYRIEREDVRYSFKGYAEALDSYIEKCSNMARHCALTDTDIVVGLYSESDIRKQMSFNAFDRK